MPKNRFAQQMKPAAGASATPQGLTSVAFRVTFPPSTEVRTIIFDERWTGADALAHVATLTEVESVGDYGLFIPPSTKSVGTWIKAQRTLDTYALSSDDVIEFKQKFRPLRIAMRNGTYKTSLIDDMMTVRELMPVLMEKIGPTVDQEASQPLPDLRKREYDPCSYDELDYSRQLREQGIIGDATVVIWKDPQGTFRLSVQFPYFEGFLMQRKTKGPFKGWKKKWFLLRKDRLYWGRKQGDENDTDSLPMQRVSLVHATNNIPGISRKFAGKCFQVITVERVLYFIADSVLVQGQWVGALETARRMFAGDASFWTHGKPTQHTIGVDNAPDEGVVDEYVMDELEHPEKEVMTEVEVEFGDTGLFTDNDREYCARLINTTLPDDAPVGHRLPIDPQGVDLFRSLRDGVVMCHMVNRLWPDAVQTEELRVGSANPDDWAANVQLLMDACTRLNVDIADISAVDLCAGRARSLMSLMNEVLRKKEYDALMLNQSTQMLVADHEYGRLPPEELLLRWVNHHLRRHDGYGRTVTNFTTDFQDSENYVMLLNALEPGLVDMRVLDTQDAMRRAQVVCDKAGSICNCLLQPSDILQGNPRTNMHFVGQLFQKYPDLNTTSSGDMGDYTPLDYDFIAATLNGALIGDGDVADKLAIGPAPDLYQKSRDGAMLCKLLKQLFPSHFEGIVRLVVPASSRDDFVNNLKLAMDNGMALGLDMDPGAVHNIADGVPASVIDAFYQVLRGAAQQKISTNPDLVYLINPDEEDLSLLEEMELDELMKRWVNVHLANNAGATIAPSSVANLGADMADCTAFAHVCNQIMPDGNFLGVLGEPDLTARAGQLLQRLRAKQIKTADALAPELLAAGATQTNLLLLSDLFNAYPTLAPKYDETDLGDFLLSDKAYLANVLNKKLGGDADIGYMFPIDPAGHELYAKLRDGLALCKLINHEFPNTIDERCLNFSTDKGVGEMVENVNIALHSAKAMGCNVGDLNAQEIARGDPKQLLQLTYQILRSGLASRLKVGVHPELAMLGDDVDDESEMNRLDAMPPEDLLLRWVNHQMGEAKVATNVADFGGGLADGEALCVVMSQVAPDVCSTRVITQTPQVRAAKVCENAQKLGLDTFITPEDIASGNAKLNLLFVGDLFEHFPALDNVALHRRSTVVDITRRLAEFTDFQEESREERAFRAWTNSLNLGIETNNLFDDLKDGKVLLQILDTIAPGLVEWRRVSEPNNKFKRIENCAYAVDLCKGLGLSTVNISGKDIADGSRKLTLALMWQVVRFSTLKMLSSLKTATGGGLDEDDIIAWANDVVVEFTGDEGKAVYAFTDDSLSDGVYLLDLLAACKPSAVNYMHVQGGYTSEEKRENACYTISTAWKMGIPAFLLWEDIVEVKHKMILTFVAQVMQRYGDFE